MKIEINNNRKILAIQKEFTNIFSNLNIEFYEKPDKQSGSSAKKIIKSNKTLAECRAVHNSGFITILSGMSVGELKQNFRDVFGLNIDIFKNYLSDSIAKSAMSDNNILENIKK